MIRPRLSNSEVVRIQPSSIATERHISAFQKTNSGSGKRWRPIPEPKHCFQYLQNNQNADIGRENRLFSYTLQGMYPYLEKALKILHKDTHKASTCL